MALDELLDEHEQSEKLRAWLRKRGPGLITALAVLLAMIGGWNWWTQHSHQQRLATGDAYQSVQAALAAGDVDTATRMAADLHEGAYAELIALDLARAQVDAGKLDDAIASLRRAETGNPALQRILQQRLARLLIANGQGGEALAALAEGDDAATLEIRGDAYFSLNQPDEARQAYRDALRKLDAAAPQRGLVEYKLVQVGGTPERRDEGLS